MCTWPKKPLDIAYHNTEWGVPLHDDDKLFEFIVLDTFQAGLSWSTILAKRENFRKAFGDFNAARIARYTDKKLAKLMQDTGIIRNQLKIKATVTNAQSFLKLKEAHGSFDTYIWQFVNHTPVVNAWKPGDLIPATSPQSDAMSKDLYQQGFKFVGSTICYAFMQAAGMVNDHLTSCQRYEEIIRMY